MSEPEANLKGYEDVFGAFADTAVLFPLLAALSIRGDFSGPILLASAGLAYLAAGFFFRVPMPVQPLKSVAIASIAVGASSHEVRLAGALLGIVCLVLLFVDAGRWARWVPKPLIHGIQASLGVLLILQGSAFAKGFYIPAGALLIAVIVCDALNWPFMGILATGGVVWAVAHVVPIAAGHVTGIFSGQSVASDGVRFGLVVSLALPQIVLTLSNSVVGTADAAERYFGDQASRVTIKKLLCSIGFGNLISASVGGLPYCHGAGGLTAHVRGGSRTWVMNAVMGIFLLSLAALQYAGGGMQIPYPPVLLAALLGATGIFHMQLARPTWNLRGAERLRLFLMAAAVLLTRNILWSLIAGLLPEILSNFLNATPPSFASFALSAPAYPADARECEGRTKEPMEIG